MGEKSPTNDILLEPKFKTVSEEKCLKIFVAFSSIDGIELCVKVRTVKLFQQPEPGPPPERNEINDLKALTPPALGSFKKFSNNEERLSIHPSHTNDVKVTEASLRPLTLILGAIFFNFKVYYI